MQREIKPTWSLFVQILAGFWGSALLVAVVMAGESEATRELVRRIGVDDADLWNEAPKLYASIAADSTLKAAASQAMALIHIRQGNYSDAWKLLSAHPKELSATPLAYRLGHEKLMLWLWLQAGSVAQAEAQFKRLVTVAVHRELPDAERRDLCHFLGSVIGMLQSSGDPSCVAAVTLEQGRASLEKLDSKMAVEQFLTGLKSATEWQRLLQERLDAFSQADPKQADSILSTLKQDSENRSTDLAKSLAEIIQENNVKDQLNKEQNALQNARRMIIAAWNTPTRGFPVIPQEPKFRSRVDRKYKTIHITDPTTGERTTKKEEIPLSSSEKRELEEDHKEYEKARKRYETDVQTYPARVAEWKRKDATRRSQLQENKKKIDAAIADKKLSIDEVQAEIRAKMASSKSLENELRLSKASIAIATIAKQLAESKLPVPGPLVKPSYFELLTWETEVYRLEKCLRETRH